MLKNDRDIPAERIIVILTYYSEVICIKGHWYRDFLRLDHSERRVTFEIDELAQF